MTLKQASQSSAKQDAIGAMLKDERRRVGLTQTEAAEQFKISLKTLRNLEQGVGGVSLATTSKILAYFGKELRFGDIVVSPKQIVPSRPRKHLILETLALVRPVLIKKFHVSKLSLFGSAARDEAKKGSDIDLAITFDCEADFELIGKLTAFLETLFDGQKVDLVDERKMLSAVKQTAKADFIHVI